MSDEKATTPTPAEVREIGEALRALGGRLPKRSDHFHYGGAFGIRGGGPFDGFVSSLEQIAIDLEERERPGCRVPFRFTLKAQVTLHVELSEAMKGDFEEFCRELKYDGGGGGGCDGGWSMDYRFTSNVDLERATTWLREKGAQLTTEQALKDEWESRRQAYWTAKEKKT